MNRIKTLLCLMVVFVYATTADAANLPPISYGNLYQMASNGDVRSIRQEMRKGLNINIKNYNGDTLVCSAIRYNDMVAYRTALVVGADKKPACLKRIHPDVRHAFYSRYGFDEPFVWGGTGSKISTPWLIGGAVVAAGAAVAIAASGGGGGGGHDDPNAKCKNNPCADGCYTNLTCNWPTVCTSHNTCGGCDICQNEEMACAGYTYGSCQSLEYISGSCAYNSKYVKCVARTNTEGCSAYEPNNDKCTACEKDYYLSSGTCIIRTNTKGCAAYNATSDVCTACEGGYDLTDGICVERVAPEVCEGYTQEACDNEVEYISDICREDGTYHKCSPRTNTAHCDTLNPHADACEKCETGYKIAGAICVKDGEAGPCDDYIEKLNSCPNPNTQYLSSCPADSSYKRCENRTKDTSHCATLNPNADACSVCESGYHATNGVCYEDGTVCEGYTQGLSSCPNQNSQYLVSCSDDATYKRCEARTNTTGCATYVLTEDKCASCEEGYDLDTSTGRCEETVVCSGYTQGLTSCTSPNTQYLKSCSDDASYKKCVSRTNTTGCATYVLDDDKCSSCIDEYNLNTSTGRCEEIVVCSGYTQGLTSCTSPNTQYLASCVDDASYKKCEARTNTTGCATYVVDDDKCASCSSGYVFNNNTGTCIQLDGIVGTTEQNTSVILMQDRNEESYSEMVGSTAQYLNYDKPNYFNTACEEMTDADEANAAGVTMIKVINNNSYLDTNVVGLRGSDSLLEIPVISYCNSENNFCNGAIIVKTQGKGKTYGVYAAALYGAKSTQNNARADSYIWVEGNGPTYGVYSTRGYVMLATGNRANTKVVVQHYGTGNTYGVYSNGDVYTTNASGNYSNEYTTGKIYVRHIDTSTWYADGTVDYYGGDIYGIYSASNNYSSEEYVRNTKYSSITVLNQGHNNNAYGIYKWMTLQDAVNQVNNIGEINVHNLATGTAYGIYASGYGSVTNSGSIKITKEMCWWPTSVTTSSSVGINPEVLVGGTAIGIYAGTSTTTHNAGSISIDGADTAVGIYAEDGTAENKTKVINGGTITITNSTDAYGIYAVGSNVTVTNTGTISINGVSCTGSACGSANNAIVLNGGTLNQNGLMSAASLNLDNFGGNVVASTNTVFDIEEDISGDLAMSSDVVSSGFDDQYTVKNMVNAADTSGLNLSSQSALFEATLNDDGDAILNRKNFAEVVEDDSVANFLEQNYVSANNEQLFSTLKEQKSALQVNNAVNKLTGSDLFNRMTFEDLTMMRELQFDMNNKVFDMKKSHIVESGNVQPFNFDGNIGSNGRYALYNKEYGSRFSAGVGFAFADVRSDNGKRHKNSRNDQTFQLSTPFGYRFGGLKFVTAPMVGYAYGTYDRDGYNGKTYDGTVEKRMMGLYNETRYPFYFGEWKMAPTAEFNILGYRIKGKEDTADYSLNIKAQNNYSAEAGVGINISRDFELNKAQTLKMHGGIIAYHEFADPYELELGMNGMDGSYKLDDNRYGNNRTAVRLGLEYKLKEYLDVSAHLLSNINRHTRTDAAVDMKYHF